MTKAQWIYLVQNYLGGGSAPSDIRKQYRKGVISAYLGMVFNEAIVQIYNASKGDLDNLNSYVKVYDAAAISTDSTLERKYIAIPTTNTNKILQIPNNNAIRSVHLNTTPKTKCFYRRMDADDVMDSLEVGTYMAEPRWDLMGERIYFSSHISNTPYSTATTALVKMIVPWSEYSSDEDVPMPFESNNAVFDAVINRLRVQPPEDKIEDSNVVKTVTQ